MPGNDVMINGALRYYVGDSKMEDLLSWLQENGVKTWERPEDDEDSEDTQ